MRALIAGDIHGVTKWIRSLCRIAARNDASFVFVVGDYGLWTSDRGLHHKQKDPSVNPLNFSWLNQTAEDAARYGVIIVFLDGNHDNHPDARAAFPRDPKTGIRWIVKDALGWADRGAVWTLDGTRFGALGGAYTHDADIEGRNATGKWIGKRRVGVG